MEQYILIWHAVTYLQAHNLETLLYVFAQLNDELHCVLCLPLFGEPASYLIGV